MNQFVQVIDRGWGRFESQMSELDVLFIKAGLPENEQVGSATRSGSHAPFGSMDELVEIMAIHEFGSRDGHIPERSFIRSAMDENEGEIARMQEQIFLDVVDGKITADKAIDRLGVYIVSLIRKKIRDLKNPPNKPSTIKAKGSSNPLIDTGQARQSIQYVKGRGRTYNV